MSKATHSGTCQCCGSFQKLPSGALSNHGYTVQWNFFNGICSGAKELPFEVDNSLVKKFIARSENEVVRLNEEIKIVEASVDSKGVWNRNQRFWEKRELIGEEIPYRDGDGSRWKFNWVYSEKELEEINNDYHYRYRKFNTEACNHQHLNSLEEAVKYENSRYVSGLKKNITDHETYIAWQKERIANWKPKPLEPVEKKHTGPKQHLQIVRDIHIEDGKVKYKSGNTNSSCGRSNWFSILKDFRKAYKENPDSCCKGCSKRFLEIEEVIAQRKEEAKV